jgi:hypothetical protein
MFKEDPAAGKRQPVRRKACRVWGSTISVKKR